MRTDIEYFRYWSGYTVVSRPVLAVWGLGSLRMISGALLVVAMAAAVVAVARRTTRVYALALVAPFILSSHVLSMPSSAMQGALANAAAFVSVGLTAIGAARGVRGAVIGAVVGAALFNYVDLLSTPPIPWMLSAAVAGAVVLARSGCIRHGLRAVTAVGVAWPLAYGLTWLSRWLIAVLALGWDHASQVIGDKIEERTQGRVASDDPSRVSAITDNVDHWLDRVGTARTDPGDRRPDHGRRTRLAVRRHGAVRLAWFLALAAPAGVAALWYASLPNHSLIHVAKVYGRCPSQSASSSVPPSSLRRRRRSASPAATVVADLQVQDGPDEAGKDDRETEDRAEAGRHDDPHLLDRVEVGEAGPPPPQQ